MIETVFALARRFLSRPWSDGLLRQVVMAVLIAAFLTGCASKYPEYSEEIAKSGSDYEYIIGAGDMLDVFVWGYEDLSVTIPVRPDGKITTRLVEDMPASGKTPTQLARDIEQKYRKFVKNPTVSVSIAQFVGTAAQQVKVVGGGANPRTIPFNKGMTLLDLMIIVGGLGEFSSGNKSVLVRKTGTEINSFNVRINDLIQKGDISANLQLRPGDILIIPESWF